MVEPSLRLKSVNRSPDHSLRISRCHIFLLPRHPCLLDLRALQSPIGTAEKQGVMAYIHINDLLFQSMETQSANRVPGYTE